MGRIAWSSGLDGARKPPLDGLRSEVLAWALLSSRLGVHFCMIFFSAALFQSNPAVNEGREIHNKHKLIHRFIFKSDFIEKLL